MSWSAIYTKPLQEFKLRDELSLLKITHFLPVQLKTEIKRRKKIIVSEPLFPSYLFAYINGNDNWNSINTCKSASYIIQNAGKPIVIPTGTIEILKMAENAGAFDFRMGKPKFRPGDNVEILQGPFTGLIAKVQSASPRKRVKVLMNLLGSQIPAEIDEEDLKEAI